MRPISDRSCGQARRLPKEIDSGGTVYSLRFRRLADTRTTTTGVVIVTYRLAGPGQNRKRGERPHAAASRPEGRRRRREGKRGCDRSRPAAALGRDRSAPPIAADTRRRGASGSAGGGATAGGGGGPVSRRRLVRAGQQRERPAAGGPVVGGARPDVAPGGGEAVPRPASVPVTRRGPPRPAGPGCAGRSGAGWSRCGRRSPRARRRRRAPTARGLFEQLRNPYYLGRRGRADADPGLGRRLDVAAERVRGGRPDDGRTSSPPSTSPASTACAWSSRAAATATRAPRARADSLLIWTRGMDAVTVHDAFVGAGCAGRHAPQPAVTVGAGALWGPAYAAVTTQRGPLRPGRGLPDGGRGGAGPERRLRQLLQGLRDGRGGPAGGRGGHRRRRGAGRPTPAPTRTCSGGSRAAAGGAWAW